MKHGTIMLIFLRNNSLQLSFIIVRGFLVLPTLCDSHFFSSCPLKPSQSLSSPRNPVSCLPPTLLLNVYAKSVTQPQPFRSFFFVFSSLSLSIPPSRPLLYCLSIVEETVAQTNRERRYPMVYHKIGEKEWQRDSRGEEDAWTDMRVKLITGDCQLEGKVMGLFASPRHPKNITSSHHVYPLQPQDHSSHQPSLETAQKQRGLRLGNMQAVFADMANTGKWQTCSSRPFLCHLYSQQIMHSCKHVLTVAYTVRKNTRRKT